MRSKIDIDGNETNLSRPTNTQCELDCLHMRNTAFLKAVPLMCKFSSQGRIEQDTLWITGSREGKHQTMRTHGYSQMIGIRDNGTIGRIDKLPRGGFYVLKRQKLHKYFPDLITLPKEYAVIIEPKIDTRKLCQLQENFPEMVFGYLESFEAGVIKLLNHGTSYNYPHDNIQLVPHALIGLEITHTTHNRVRTIIEY